MTIRRTLRNLFTASAVAASALLLGSCSSTGDDAVVPAAPAVWDPSSIHDISVDMDEGDYASLISTYVASGEKVWITATVTIDGATYENVGIKLKGNSSLRRLSDNVGADVSSARPESLPWIIRLDKYVDGQDHEGAEEFVVRSNTSETALNEALALDLLDQTGLATTEAIATEFAVNGSAATLRLVVENPNTDWMERELGDGYLYKAESGGDYSYRGDDAEAYAQAWDQEGGEDNLEPLIDFLQFVNESSDEEFAAGLSERLDVDAFATYLAFQTVVDNFDDIDGPGNNSYLYWDPQSQRMTVVNWDLNLAFGANPGQGADGEGFGPPPGDFENGGGVPGSPPAGMDGERPGMPPAGEMPQGPRGEGGPSRGNILSERFRADAAFTLKYDAEVERLRTGLVASGFAEDALSEWTQLLLDNAGNLVPAATVTEESEALAAKLDA
jgi:spore coat protein CotH